MKRILLALKLKVILFIWNVSLKCQYVLFYSKCVIIFFRGVKKNLDKYSIFQFSHRPGAYSSHTPWDSSVRCERGSVLNILFEEGAFWRNSLHREEVGTFSPCSFSLWHVSQVFSLLMLTSRLQNPPVPGSLSRGLHQQRIFLICISIS